MLFLFLFCQHMVITVDDLPGSGINMDNQAYAYIMGAITEVFVDQNIPAIGFVNEHKLYEDGELQSQRVDCLKKWALRGLELGNHGYQHLDLHQVPIEDFLQDIAKGDLVTGKILSNLNKSPQFFRHPFLHTGKTEHAKSAVSEFLEKRHYQIAPVTIDNSEWIYARAFDLADLAGDNKMKDRVGHDYIRYMLAKTDYYERQSQALFGRNIPQILLIHANRLNATYGEKLVRAIRIRGYSFISLEEALKDEAYKLKDTWMGHAGITWLHRWCIAIDKSLIVPNEPKTPSWILEQAELESE